MPYQELKQRQSVMWGAAPYQRVTETIADIHERVVDMLAPAPGMRWLDLACGTGAVAERAAARGASVTGIDLAPALIDTALQRAVERGLSIDYRVARRTGSCSRAVTARRRCWPTRSASAVRSCTGPGWSSSRPSTGATARSSTRGSTCS
jgi:hypothetical protein